MVVVTGLPATGPFDQMLESMHRFSSAPGYIVDLRSNSGGDENQAALLAGFFTAERTRYARNSVRRRGRMTETEPRFVSATDSNAFTRPVVCLVGPGCVSSGEGFALMMKALDHVTLMGQPTRGASGNPRPAVLSNGLEVWFSRWVSMELDGTPIEGRGVVPDIEVEPTDAGDHTFDRAVNFLSH